MNTWAYIKSKTTAAVIVIFFISIVISCGGLYLLANKFSQNLMYEVYFIVGITFLLGIISISLAVGSKDQIVIYREKQKEEASVEKIEKEASTGLVNNDTLESLLQNNEGPQKWINEISSQLQAGQAALYLAADGELQLKYGYAISNEKFGSVKYAYGEGLVGRVATEGIALYINPLPEKYIIIFSGLGSASPEYLALIPIKNNDKVIAVLEIATFLTIDQVTRQQLEKASATFGTILQSNTTTAYVQEY